MKLKKDFGLVASDMQQAAYYAALNSLKSQGYYGHANPMEALADSIAKAVGQAVWQSMMTLQANQYTDEDFEKDIGLKP